MMKNMSLYQEILERRPALVQSAYEDCRKYREYAYKALAYFSGKEDVSVENAWKRRKALHEQTRRTYMSLARINSVVPVFDVVSDTDDIGTMAAEILRACEDIETILKSQTKGA